MRFNYTGRAQSDGRVNCEGCGKPMLGIDEHDWDKQQWPPTNNFCKCEGIQKMTKPIFTWQDFTDYNFSTTTGDEAAKKANAKLAKLIESAPVVYGNSHELNDLWNYNRQSIHTHQARLMFIEEMPKEECEHLVIEYRTSKHYAPIMEATCGICKAKLIAKWSPKDEV